MTEFNEQIFLKHITFIDKWQIFPGSGKYYGFKMEAKYFLCYHMTTVIFFCILYTRDL